VDTEGFKDPLNESKLHRVASLDDRSFGGKDDIESRLALELIER